VPLDFGFEVAEARPVHPLVEIDLGHHVVANHHAHLPQRRVEHRIFAARLHTGVDLAAARDGIADYVGLIEAIEAGDVEARLILQDETAGRIIVTNKTKQPLTVKLPDAFAGAPVLAQIGWGPNFGNNNNNNNGGGNQAVGAGIGLGNNAGIFAIDRDVVDSPSAPLHVARARLNWCSFFELRRSDRKTLRVLANRE
jgi:hypothetical protein